MIGKTFIEIQDNKIGSIVEIRLFIYLKKKCNDTY